MLKVNKFFKIQRVCNGEFRKMRVGKKAKSGFNIERQRYFCKNREFEK